VSTADLIVIAGAPGVGKSTLCAKLKSRLGSPYLEFSNFRSPHLDPLWSDANEDEHDMAFDNLVYVTNNYLQHGYRPVILTDLVDQRLADVSTVFGSRELYIFTLVLEDESELRRRLENRTSGFRDQKRAVVWNRELLSRPLYSGEIRIDVTGRSPAEIASQIEELLGDA
jgi:broad-specificity NMP kinase